VIYVFIYILVALFAIVTAIITLKVTSDKRIYRFLANNGREWLLYPGGAELAKRANHYNLSKPEDDVILVNLDKNVWGNTLFRLRRRVLFWAAKDRPLVPVGFRALDRPHISRRSIQLIERRGRECVFQAADMHKSNETHYFLSGFDRNEWPRPLYFLAELPRKVTSIKDAREALKPPSVVKAEELGRRVYRQGDIFAIPTKITDKEILEKGGIIDERVVNGRFGYYQVRARKLYGTAHTASRVASLPDGTQLAWNYLYHEPSLIGRTDRKDHRRCPLKPRRWHLVARNTVPIRKPEPNPEPPSSRRRLAPVPLFIR